MAKRKRAGRSPQPQHANKSTLSQHDKRSRLAKPNLGRRITKAAAVPLVGGVAVLVAAMSRLLDKRIAFRLPIVIAGAMLAIGLCYSCRGVMTERRHQTFLATSHIVGGMVRVVMLEHPDGNWAAYICTEVAMFEPIA